MQNFTTLDHYSRNFERPSTKASYPLDESLRMNKRPSDPVTLTNTEIIRKMEQSYLDT
jgi:hypothetical protein